MTDRLTCNCLKNNQAKSSTNTGQVISIILASVAFLPLTAVYRNSAPGVLLEATTGNSDSRDQQLLRQRQCPADPDIPGNIHIKTGIKRAIGMTLISRTLYTDSHFMAKSISG